MSPRARSPRKNFFAAHEITSEGPRNNILSPRNNYWGPRRTAHEKTFLQPTKSLQRATKWHDQHTCACSRSSGGGSEFFDQGGVRIFCSGGCLKFFYCIFINKFFPVGGGVRGKKICIFYLNILYFPHLKNTKSKVICVWKHWSYCNYYLFLPKNVRKI